MEQLPKLVRERLAATAKPGVHPDPDVLTAFAEDSLLDRERASVLSHLAHCAECREVVALAAPQLELEEMAAVAAASPSHPPPPRARWFRPPVLRWGALAASVIVVGAAVLVYRKAGEKENATFVASRQQASEAAPANAVAKIEPSEKPSTPQSGAAQAAVADELRESSAAKRASPSGSPLPPQALPAPRRDLTASAGLGSPGIAEYAPAKKSSRGAESQQANTIIAGNLGELGAAQSSARPANAPFARLEKDKSRVSSQAKEAPPPPPPPSAPANETAAAAAPVPSSAETLQVITVPTKPEAAKQANAKAVPEVRIATGAFAASSSKELSLDRMRTASDLPTPRWSLSTDGTMLLRSTDNGKTWQTIPVASHVVLLSVDAFGSQVWVGGGAGALYHSADAGEHWMQVKPVAGDRPLTDDVTQIHFTDEHHGELVTLHHQVWTTSDGGHTWQVK